jgi:membrane fusion protein (multidrug efflux system)
LESGNPVSRGQVVGEIINREVQAAKNGLEIARQLDPNSAKALADSIKPYIGQMGVPITVPQAGVVANRLASSGQMVNDLDPLADIIDPSSIYVDAVVPVDDLNWIKPGMSASVVSPLDPSNYIQARVAALSPSFSQSGATESARVEFTGAKRIAVAGAPVEVTVTIRYIPDALVVPEPALFEDAADDQYYVFVAGSDGYARRIRVGIGIRNPGKVQITAGLKPGYIVITSGGYALSNGLKVSVAVAH